MLNIITPDALGALQAMLDEQTHRGGNHDDPFLIQAWLDALGAETGNHPLIEASPHGTKAWASLFVEEFKSSSARVKLAIERDELQARIDALDRAAVAP